MCPETRTFCGISSAYSTLLKSVCTVRAGSRTGVSARVRPSVPMRLGEAVAQFVVGEQGGAAVGVVDGRDLEVEAFRGVIDRHRGLLGGLRRLVSWSGDA